jgi:phage shock protein PspC (stress-responsive transcriptional regulator)
MYPEQPMEGVVMSATEQRDIVREQRPRRRLYRSRRNRVIAGVCGGIAEYLGWSPTRVRVLTLLSFLLPGTQVVIYLLLWIFVPSEPREI